MSSIRGLTRPARQLVNRVSQRGYNQNHVLTKQRVAAGDEDSYLKVRAALSCPG